MQSYNIHIPRYSTIDKKISDAETIFLGLIKSLANKYGYCWASNKMLAEMSRGKTPRQIQKYIKHLVEVGYLVVEIQQGYLRKIWPTEELRNKDFPERIYGPDPGFQKITPCELQFMGGANSSSSNTKIDTKIKRKVGKERKRLAAPPPPTSSSSKNEMRLTQTRCLELTKEEYKQAMKITESCPVLEKYCNNARNHLTKYPNSYKKLSFLDIVLKFYRDDLDKQTKYKPPTQEQTLSKQEQGKKLLATCLACNPHLAEHIAQEKNCVTLGIPCGNYTGTDIDYASPMLLQEIEQFLKKLGRPYRLPSSIEKNEQPKEASQ